MEILRHGELDYAISYPKDFRQEEKYPLVIYLHGAGGRGRDISAIANHGFFGETEQFLAGEILTVPQCYADSWFDIFEQLQDFVAAQIARDCVDPARVYVVGASMGGYTTWQLAMSRPEWFAAIIPICGGGMYWNAARLKNMGVWAFHGKDDQTVLCEESIKMVDAINKRGGSARLTVYENTAHNAWTPTFQNPEVWQWLLAQTNRHQQVRTEFNDVKTYG